MDLIVIFPQGIEPYGLTKMEIDKDKYLLQLKTTFNSYAPISEESWLIIQALVRFELVKHGEIILRAGQTARNLHYICKGSLRAFIGDGEGNVYNKNIFLEGQFAGSKVSYLLNKPSNFTLEGIEDSVLISMNYKKYREAIESYQDLKDFYIAYLERNWVIEKEQREVSIVMENGTTRYLQLLSQHPDIDKRIPQRHIASHLGITPTQLSRIRKNLKKNP